MGLHLDIGRAGNGNITTLINTDQIAVAKYLYEPFSHVALIHLYRRDAGHKFPIIEVYK